MTTDWNNLVKEIERGHCAIFLGHGLLCDPGGSPLYAQFCNQLAKEHEDLINTYYPEENFFLFKALKNRRKFTNQIDDYYKTLEHDQELYRMLAEIPVSLYISISPDNFLEKALGEIGQTAFFNDTENKGTEIEASQDKPLVYHIFGSTEDSNSLLLSHDDLFHFFKSILGEQSLPRSIKKFFREDAGGEVIFLGFAFRKWYVQLLLRLFNLSKTDNELNRTAYLDTEPLEEEKMFAEQNFQVEFIETRIKEFVVTLHRKCKEKGILRTINDSKDTPPPPPPNDRKKELESTLVQKRKERAEEVKKLWELKNKMRNEWEQLQIFSIDPRERMKCDMEIEKLKEEIEKLKEEYKSLSS